VFSCTSKPVSRVTLTTSTASSCCQSGDLTT